MYICDFFKGFFDVKHFLKSLLNLFQYCLFCALIFWPKGMWNLTSLARDWICTLCICIAYGDASGKEPVCQCRSHKRGRFDPRSGKSPGGGNGNPLQCSCLENPIDMGAWRATVHRVAESDMIKATKYTWYLNTLQFLLAFLPEVLNHFDENHSKHTFWNKIN